jgi:hypothetical protein
LRAAHPEGISLQQVVEDLARSHHTVAAVRTNLERDGQTAHLQSRVTADGKTRVIRKPSPERQNVPAPGHFISGVVWGDWMHDFIRNPVAGRGLDLKRLDLDP